VLVNVAAVQWVEECQERIKKIIMGPNTTSGLALAALLAGATAGVKDRPNRVPSALKSIVPSKDYMRRQARNKMAKQSRKKNRH